MTNTIRLEDGVEIQVGQDTRTFRDLLYGLLREQRIAHEDYEVCYLDEEDSSILTCPMDDQVPSELSRQYFLRWATFPIHIRERDQTYTLQTSPHTTISALRTHFYNQTSQTLLNPLSHKGVRLNDTDSMTERDITKDSVLYSVFSISIIDPLCELQISVDVYEFTRISELREIYAQASRRYPTFQSTFSVEGRVLEDSQNVFSAKVEHGGQLEFNNPSFGIVVVEHGEEHDHETHLTVSDHELISQLREKFCKETRQALEEADTLLFQGTTLDNDMMIFKSGVASGSRLELQREDSSLTLVYECGDCGSDVKLKRSEPIRCRLCGCRIVYKKRTTRRMFL